VHGEAWASLPGSQVALHKAWTTLDGPHCFVLSPLQSNTSIHTMESKTGPALGEKQFHDGSPDPADRESLAQGENTLHKSLKGRHMQMIAM
jgi:hypothetical protein